MSPISEFEPRRRNYDVQEEGRLPGKSHRGWPASAWFVAVTMIALNLGLGAFLVKSEYDRRSFHGMFGGDPDRGSRPNEAAPSPKPSSPVVETPKTGSRPDVQTQQNPLPDQTSVPETNARDAANTVHPTDRGENSEPSIVPLKSHSAPIKPVRTAASGNRRWTPTVPTMHQEPARRFVPEPQPQARFAAPRTPTVTAPMSAPTPDPVITPPAVVASAPAPTAGVRSQPEASRKVITPAAGGTTAKRPQPVLDPTAGQSQKQPVRVATVGLPAMDKGIVVPKTPVGSGSPKIEIVHRPPEPKINVPNCGGDVLIPCPTLKKRPAGGTPEGDRW